MLRIGFSGLFRPTSCVDEGEGRLRQTDRGHALKRPRIEELDCPVEVRRHPGARRLTLRVSRTRRAVIVTLPVQCDLGEAGSFLNRNIEWVRERLSSIPMPVPFADGALMPLRGEFHRVVFTGKRATGGVVSAQANGAAQGAARIRPRRACPAPAARLAGRGSAPRSRRPRAGAYARARRQSQAHRRTRSGDPLGLLLDDGRAVVLLAAHPGATAHPRLRRRARSGPSGRDEPRPALLGARRAAAADDERRQALAAGVRPRPAPLRPVRARRLQRPPS